MQPIWNAGSIEARQFPQLTETVHADVAIIGGGITGLSTALSLADAGYEVALIEAFGVGERNTGRSTGNLYSTVSQGLSGIREQWDDATVRDVVESRTRALDGIEHTIRRFGIDCQFARRPLYCVTTGDDDDTEQWLDREYEACVAGGLAANLTEDVPLPFATHRALCLENQAQYNPLSHARALAQVVSGLGVSVFEHSRVLEDDAANGVVRTAQGEVRAQHVVHATHSPNGLRVVQTRMQTWREPGISAKLAGAPCPDGIFWVQDGFHSLRSYRHDGSDYLVVVGEKHEPGDGTAESDHNEQLRAYAHTRFDVSSFEHTWSAQQFASADLLPFIGRMATGGDVYVGTGFAADGLVWGVVAAGIISDLIGGRENQWCKRFDPGRIMSADDANHWLRENAESAEQFERELNAGELEHLREAVPPGHSGVAALGEQQFAVRHGKHGELEVMSALCPHKKCVVQWNDAEATWDCPCHGSRFHADGTVLEGPTYSGLPQRASFDG